MTPDSILSKSKALLWILCLAFLSVAARNFEEGLSVDAPLYAAFARNIARTNEWFYIHAGIPEYTPWFDHPHLGFWLIALVFKILPAADWSARIVGHLLYVGFLWMFFLFVRKNSSERVAVLSVLLLWIWFRFSNFFSNVYLDPGALFFGTAAVFLFDLCLEKSNRKLAVLSGICLAFCGLYKGLTFLGYFPLLAFLVFYHRKKPTRHIFTQALLVMMALLLVGSAYFILLRTSRVPDFLSQYWNRQMTHRFTQTWNWWLVASPPFWKALCQDTYYLFPFTLLSLRKFSSSNKLIGLAWVGVLSFVFMFAPAQRISNQYSLLILPWVALLIAEGLAFSFPVKKVVTWTAAIAIGGMFVLQYFPIRTHTALPPSETNAIRLLKQHIGIEKVFLDLQKYSGFFESSRIAWYGDVVVEYPGIKIPNAERKALYLLSYQDSTREQTLKNHYWCLHESFGGAGLWKACLNKAK